MMDNKSGNSHLQRLRRLPKPLRIIYARPRTFISLAVGLVALFIMPNAWWIVTRLLIAWDIFITFYITLALILFFSSDTARIRHQATIQDDGRFLVLILTAVAAFATIAAIVLELSIKPQQAPQLIISGATIMLSWTAIHFTFALHYAHDYYRTHKPGGLAFPGNDEPDYWDFVYFSFIIGMTGQVSDVGITDKIIRRTATAHGMVSFFFNTALLALMINIAASAI